MKPVTHRRSNVRQCGRQHLALDVVVTLTSVPFGFANLSLFVT